MISFDSALSSLLLADGWVALGLSSWQYGYLYNLAGREEEKTELYH